VTLDTAPEHLKVKQVAELLNIGESTVYALLDRGEIPKKKIGGSVRICKKDLTKYLKECEV
jgi:excisionase family DNA binding protein